MSKIPPHQEHWDLGFVKRRRRPLQICITNKQQKLIYVTITTSSAKYLALERNKILLIDSFTQVDIHCADMQKAQILAPVPHFLLRKKQHKKMPQT